MSVATASNIPQTQKTNFKKSGIPQIHCLSLSCTPPLVQLSGCVARKPRTIKPHPAPWTLVVYWRKMLQTSFHYCSICFICFLLSAHLKLTLQNRKNNCCFGGVCLDSKGCGLILRWQDDRSHGTCQKLSKQKLVWILECPRWTITFGIGGWPATMGFPSARDKSLTWLAKVTCETMVDELCESLKKYPRVFRRARAVRGRLYTVHAWAPGRLQTNCNGSDGLLGGCATRLRLQRKVKHLQG